MSHKIIQEHMIRFCNISQDGLRQMLANRERSQYQGQHLLWTEDKTIQLPVKITTSGISSLKPTTLLEEWNNNLQKYSECPALSVKRNQQWHTLTYKQYHHLSMKFAHLLTQFNIPEFSSVIITGFNAPEWVIAFHGSVMARCIPVGVYPTTSKGVCEYISKDSGARIVIAENAQLAQNYADLLENGSITKIIIYNEDITSNQYQGNIIYWSTFIEAQLTTSQYELKTRQKKIKPGNCCSIMYTSGTTGRPKGVMLSHDNFTWTMKAVQSRERNPDIEKGRFVSYLPLAYAGALFFDVFLTFHKGCHIFFADPSALQGTLLETLKEVKPHAFFSIPRIWEKIYSRLIKQQKQLHSISKNMIRWARQHGQQGSMKQARGESTNWSFSLADSLIFSKIKKAFGLEQCIFFGYGGAPLDPKVRKYFNTINILLVNGYGMTETTAPQSTTHLMKFNPQTPAAYLQVGHSIPGAQTHIFKTDHQDIEGEICMRGRNVCMGYLNNAELTSRTFNNQGYLHSGDIGRINQEGELFITGRIKELIVTSNGQKISPLAIQNEIKKALPFLSNVMIVGENRPYLSCLITLPEEPQKSGTIEQTAANYLYSGGCHVKTIHEASKHPNFKNMIMEGLKQANSHAFSKTQQVHNYYLLREDFSIDNGTLTPSMKLKRGDVIKKYRVEIDNLYESAKL